MNNDFEDIKTDLEKAKTLLNVPTLYQKDRVEAIKYIDKVITKLSDLTLHPEAYIKKAREEIDAGIFEGFIEEYWMVICLQNKISVLEKELKVNANFVYNQAIAATPTGNLKNKLTELNILRLKILGGVKDKNKVWCVKHSDGWCAVKDNCVPEELNYNIPTVCKKYIILPLGFEEREPNCEECKSETRNNN